MTVTGIIAEFNPFHNGHKYLLSQAEGILSNVVSLRLWISGHDRKWLCEMALI